MSGASPVETCEYKISRHQVCNPHLLLLPQGEKADTGDLDDLEADTRNITLGLAATTETRDEDFVVLVNEVQATIVL